MFSITLVFVTLLIVPVTAFKQKNELIHFYWVGVWAFLAMIAAFSGGWETLKLLKYDAGNVPVAMLSALIACFVCFVMFAWFRLSFAAIRAGVTRFLNRRRNA
jgi:hypothetical protein